MSLSCPHCGAEIVGLIPGSAPLPGWRNPAQSGAESVAQSVAQSGIAQGSEVQDLEVQDLTPSRNSPPRRAYGEGYPAEFLTFWIAYPRKRDKRKALKAWRNAIRRNSPDAILAGAIRYRDDPNRQDEFTKYAEGWLNGDGWEDEPLPARISTRRPPDPPRSMTSGEMDRAIEEALRDA